MKLAFVGMFFVSSVGFAQAIHVGQPNGPKVRVLAPGTNQGTQPAQKIEAKTSNTTTTTATGSSMTDTTHNKSASSKMKEKLLAVCPNPSATRPTGVNSESTTEWDIVPVGVNSKTYSVQGQAIHVGGSCDFVTVHFNTDGSITVNRSNCSRLENRNGNSPECLSLLGL